MDIRERWGGGCERLTRTARDGDIAVETESAEAARSREGVVPPLIHFQPTIGTVDYCLGEMEITSPRTRPAEPYCLAYPGIWIHLVGSLAHSLPPGPSTAGASSGGNQ